MIETMPSVTSCAYCGGNLRPGLTEQGLLPVCGPSIRIALICSCCGNLQSPFPLPSIAHT